MKLDWFRKFQPALWMGVGIAVANLAWVMIARYASVRPAPRPKVQPVYTGYDTGGKDVKILQFYASSGDVVEGDSVILCYGVVNARAVRIEPPIEAIKPALNRCFSVVPDRTSTYTLFAEGHDGAVVSASFTVRLSPRPARIKFVTLSDTAVRRGEPATMCYEVTDAAAVRLDPVGYKLPAADRACYKWFPAATLKYTLVVQGAGGADRESFRIAVR